MKCKESYFKGKEDLNIHVYKYTSENIKPKAVIQIAHGITAKTIDNVKNGKGALRLKDIISWLDERKKECVNL